MTTSNNNAKLWSKLQEQKIEDLATASGINGKIENGSLPEMVKLDEFKGKTVNQLRAKIVNMGYYKKAEPKTANPETGQVTRKIDFVKAIQTLTGVNDLGTLEKASKPQLEALSNALVALSEQENVKQDK